MEQLSLGLELMVEQPYGNNYNGIPVREYSEEAGGLIYKSYTNFRNKEGICYINIYGGEYTYDDILELAEGNVTLAYTCFSLLGEVYNYPDSFFENAVEDGYITQCPKCGHVYVPYSSDNLIDNCPRCELKQQFLLRTVDNSIGHFSIDSLEEENYTLKIYQDGRLLKEETSNSFIEAFEKGIQFYNVDIPLYRANFGRMLFLKVEEAINNFKESTDSIFVFDTI